MAAISKREREKGGNKFLQGGNYVVLLNSGRHPNAVRLKEKLFTGKISRKKKNGFM